MKKEKTGIKYVGHFNGEEMYGNNEVEKALEWYRFNLEIVTEKNTNLEQENFSLKCKSKTFLQRLFKI